MQHGHLRIRLTFLQPRALIMLPKHNIFNNSANKDFVQRASQFLSMMVHRIQHAA
jgi:hypothetical protein